MFKTNSGFSMHLALPIIAVIGVLGIGGYVAKHTYDVKQERKQFMAAKAEVDKLGEAIARETHPAKHQAVQFCDYGHAKFEKAGRTCWIKYYLSLESENESVAIRYFNTSKQTLIKEGYKFITFQDGTSTDFSELRGGNFSTRRLKSCGIYLNYNSDREYIAYNRRSFPGMNFDPTKNSAILTLSCSGEAMAEHFPVRKS